MPHRLFESANGTHFRRFAAFGSRSGRPGGNIPEDSIRAKHWYGTAIRNTGSFVLMSCHHDKMNESRLCQILFRRLIPLCQKLQAQSIQLYETFGVFLIIGAGVIFEGYMLF